MSPSGNLVSDGRVYVLEAESKLEDVVAVKKFKSLQSGMTVYIAQVEGPLVHGFFNLATEAHDDDGLPHTLEHLIFLGSEEYPFKGVLDLVANRCLASGTNAWTAVDSTCYTVSTAGSQGFLTFLPVYLEHILFPTLTDSGFVTEVHHVNGKGEDGGVVYCEMQAIENSGVSLVSDRFMKTMYPEGCGYRSQTGGAVRNLQESTTHQKVKEYHRRFYRSENLCVIVVGSVSPQQVFDSLKPVEEKIISKKRDEFVRPWRSAVPPLSSAIETQVEFPSDDEESGIVKVGWRAPPRSDIDAIVAVDVLLSYLQETSISPLQKEFIEVDDPLCGQIEKDDSMYMNMYFALNFENVPVHYLSSVRQKLFEVLTKVTVGEIKIDESRMGDVIQRRIWSIYSLLESEPKDLIADYLIGDSVYGNGNFEKHVNRVKVLEKLKSNVSDVDWWQNLLKQYLLTNHHVSVVGIPSLKLKEKLAKDEELRVEKQIQSYGEEGLEKQALLIENSLKNNDICPPNEMIGSFPVPDISSINFHPISRSCNHSVLVADDNQLFPLSHLPYHVQLDDLHSKFATIIGIMDTSVVPRKLKLFLPLLMELLLESPIIRNNELIPQEQVMAELSRDTVAFKTSLGVCKEPERFVCGSYAQMALLYLQVDVDHYVQGVTWLHDLLFNTKMAAERVKIVVKKMLSDVARLKRDGYFVAKVLAGEQCFRKESNYRVNSLCRQHAFLTALLAKLATDPQPVMNALEELKSILTSFANLTVHLAIDVACLSKHFGGRKDLIWKQKCPSENIRDADWIWSQPLQLQLQRSTMHVERCHELCASLCETAAQSAVVGLGSVESNFLVLSAPSITDFKHPDLPPLLVFLQYMCQLEGPLWKQIRGLGLAYHYSVTVKPNRGLITALLYRSTDVVGAFKQLINIMDNHLNGVTSWDLSLLESARSSLLYDLIREVDCVTNLVFQSIKLHFDSLDNNYHKDLLKAVSSVGMEDMQKVAAKYVPVLFDPSKAILSICCNSAKVEAVCKGFNELSRSVKSFTLEGSFVDELDDCDKTFLC